MTRAIQFTQAQVRRAVKAAESAGLKVNGVRVFPDGSIRVETGEDGKITVDKRKAALAGSSWDDM